MKRREFITLIGGTAAAWPLAARAQRADQMRRIGVLMSIADGDLVARGRVAAFEERLRSLGWSMGQNVHVDWRWAAGDPNRMKAYAAELVAMKMEVIVANSPQVTGVLAKETKDIPIVFVQVADPLGSGFVASLAKPGGNVTGFASFDPQLGGKWLEILKEIAPRVARAQILLELTVRRLRRALTGDRDRSLQVRRRASRRTDTQFSRNQGRDPKACTRAERRSCRAAESGHRR